MIFESLVIKLEKAIKIYPKVKSLTVVGGVFNSEK